MNFFLNKNIIDNREKKEKKLKLYTYTYIKGEKIRNFIRLDVNFSRKKIARF